MGNEAMLKKAKKVVVDYYASKFENNYITEKDVFIVWFCKTLQNWKALVSTVAGDGMYFEVTYNGDKHATYLDAYTKCENVRIVD